MLEIPDALVGNEECADGAVAIVGDEPAMAYIELCATSIAAPQLQNVLSRVRVPELLREVKILLARDVAEFVSVLGKMLLEQVRTAKPAAARDRESRPPEYEEDEEYRSIASQ